MSMVAIIALAFESNLDLVSTLELSIFTISGVYASEYT